MTEKYDIKNEILIVVVGAIAIGIFIGSIFQYLIINGDFVKILLGNTIIVSFLVLIVCIISLGICLLALVIIRFLQALFRLLSR